MRLIQGERWSIRILVLCICSYAGTVLGLIFGAAYACAKMLGDAEIYPLHAIPPAPDITVCMMLGAFRGLAAGIALGIFLCVLPINWEKFIQEDQNSFNGND